MIESVTQRLFTRTPVDTLYHYTSFSGMLGIIDSGTLRASDIRYMNDSAELRHTLDLLGKHITRRIISGSDNPSLLNQFLDWLSRRIVDGPLLFGASFRANGNLLSQWRGYSVHGKGVSLGFDPAHIRECARRQQFEVGKCLYDPTLQETLIEKVVQGIEDLAGEQGDGGEQGSWHRVFEQVEGDLLRIAAILKHPAFEEEQEWRIVSPAMTDCSHPGIHFREGASMLVPYFGFRMNHGKDAGAPLEHVFLGPTGNIELSMNSLKLYLHQRRSFPARGLSYCQIPYRQRQS
jgi:hypothetical protein